MPDPGPRPTRVLPRLAPPGFASLLSASATVHLFDSDQMHHLFDGAAKRGRVADDHAAARTRQSKAVNGRAHGLLLPDGASRLRHAELGLHGSAFLFSRRLGRGASGWLDFDELLGLFAALLCDLVKTSKRLQRLDGSPNDV